jgi:hypothetical protein
MLLLHIEISDFLPSTNDISLRGNKPFRKKYCIGICSAAIIFHCQNYHLLLTAGTNFLQHNHSFVYPNVMFCVYFMTASRASPNKKCTETPFPRWNSYRMDLRKDSSSKSDDHPGKKLLIAVSQLFHILGLVTRVFLCSFVIVSKQSTIVSINN